MRTGLRCRGYNGPIHQWHLRRSIFENVQCGADCTARRNYLLTRNIAFQYPLCDALRAHQKLTFQVKLR